MGFYPSQTLLGIIFRRKPAFWTLLIERCLLARELLPPPQSFGGCGESDGALGGSLHRVERQTGRESFKPRGFGISESRWQTHNCSPGFWSCRRARTTSRCERTNQNQPRGLRSRPCPRGPPARRRSHRRCDLRGSSRRGDADPGNPIPGFRARGRVRRSSGC